MTKEHNARSFVIATVGTIVVTALAAAVVRYLTEQTAENLARLAAGESDWERHHPHD